MEPPKSLKKKGASVAITLNSQKTEKPPQSKLKGIKNASELRSIIPVFGLPVQISFSPELKFCLNSFSMS